MRRNKIIIVIAAIAVLFVCILSAGCTSLSSSTDPIVGTFVANSNLNNEKIIFDFQADGTVRLAISEGRDIDSYTTLSWRKIDDNVYETVQDVYTIIYHLSDDKNTMIIPYNDGTSEIFARDSSYKFPTTTPTVSPTSSTPKKSDSVVGTWGSISGVHSLELKKNGKGTYTYNGKKYAVRWEQTGPTSYKIESQDALHMINGIYYLVGGDELQGGFYFQRK